MKVLVVQHDNGEYDAYWSVVGVVTTLDAAMALVKRRHTQKSLTVTGPTKTHGGHSIAVKYRGNVESYEIKEFEVEGEQSGDPRGGS